jgi:spore coat protein A
MGGTMQPLTSTGSVALEPSMAGWKDVVRVAPGQLIRLIGRFGGATGQFMYHCHILDHEDEGMMRSFVVMPPEVMPFDTAHGHGGHPV